MRPHPTLPRRMFCPLSYIRPALLAFLLISLLFLDGGCSADQLQVAAQQSTSLQTSINLAQQQLADLQKQIAVERAALTTQPATTQAVAQLVKDEQKAKDISDWLDKAKPVVDQLTQAAQAVANGQTPNFTGLSAFGPYGILAGLLLSVGYGAWKTVQAQKLATQANAQAQTIAQQQPVIEHIQEITGTTNPVTAAAALTAAIPPGGVVMPPVPVSPPPSVPPVTPPPVV